MTLKRVSPILLALVLMSTSVARAIVLDFTYSTGNNSTTQTSPVASLELTQVNSDVRFDLTNFATSVVGGTPL